MSAPKAMEREFYRTERVAEGVTRIRCSVGELCYLVEGEESAALIDAASGYVGLRELVASLTDKPVRLFLTHGHRDHSGGMVQFEQAWAHAGDMRLLDKLRDDEFRSGYPKYIKPKVYSALGPEYFPRLFDTKLRFFEDGDTFPLGGTELEVIHTPGHTRGSVCFIDTARRLIFTGDTVNRCVLLTFPEDSTDLLTYRASLERIQARSGSYDRMLASHFNGEVPSNGLAELIACCDDIVSGRDGHFPAEMFHLPCHAAFEPSHIPTFRKDGGWGNIFYI